MGRGVATSLASQGYKVIVADWNSDEGNKLATEIDGDYIKVDVTSWQQQFQAFETTFNKYNRLDVVHANAGISDRVDYFLPESTDKFSADEAPKLGTVNVDLIGVIYSSLLATRYFRKNPSDVQKPMLLLTSSGIGVYPGPAAPIYSAAKHGVLGLARSLAARWKEEGYDWRSNALVPGLVSLPYLPWISTSNARLQVPTAIMPKATRERYSAEGATTSVAQIVDGVNDMLHSDMSGATCEVSRDNRWYRDAPEFKDEVQRKVIEDICSFKNIGLEFERSRKAGEQPTQ